MPAADRFATLLDPLKLRLARSTLPARLREAVLSTLPASWRDRIADEARRLCLARHGDELSLLAAGHRGDTRLGEVPLEHSLLDELRARADASGTPRWLLLPAAGVLRRVLTLPAAAEPRLREVLAFELDRQTPVSADQVSFEGRVLARDLAAQQLRVELLVLPRARLDAELAAIGPLAQGLAGVDGRGTLRWINEVGRRLPRLVNGPHPKGDIAPAEVVEDQGRCLGTNPGRDGGRLD